MNDLNLQRWTLAVLAHIALVAAWYLFVKLGNVPAFVMPSPGATLDALLQPNYNWWATIAVTATEIFAGYFLALVVGVALALAFTWSKTLEAFFMPLLVGSRSGCAARKGNDEISGKTVQRGRESREKRGTRPQPTMSVRERQEIQALLHGRRRKEEKEATRPGLRKQSPSPQFPSRERKIKEKVFHREREINE